MRLGRAMIFVGDLPKMIAFYQDKLGMRPLGEARLDNYVEFEGGLALHLIPEAARCGNGGPVEPREQNPVKLSFEVGDVAAERRRLEGLGVTILDRPWGGWDAVDPEGNVFGVVARES